MRTKCHRSNNLLLNITTLAHVIVGSTKLVSDSTHVIFVVRHFVTEGLHAECQI